MKAIVNTKLVMEDGIIWDGAILFNDKEIIAVGKRSEVDVSDADEVIDAGGLYTAPGLVDIHNHGSDEYRFADNPTGAASAILPHGVTTVLPTFYHSISKEGMIEGARKVREESKHGAGKIMRGLYMEGPFMALAGSGQNQIKWSGAIKREDFVDLIDAFGDLVLVWAIDPRRENIVDFMEYAKEHTPHAVFAHGHSAATFESIASLKKYGIRLRTHILNAGQPPARCQSLNGAGGDPFCFCEPDMFAELICDEVGIHVPPGYIKMVVRTKGVEKVCLISDHTSETGGVRYKNNEAKGIWYGPDLNYDDQGMLSGSLMTLDNGVRNMMTHTGYGICHAIRMATINPARAVGIENEVGSLEKGKKSNLIIMDDMINIKKVFLEGELAAEDGKLLI